MPGLELKAHSKLNSMNFAALWPCMQPKDTLRPFLLQGWFSRMEASCHCQSSTKYMPCHSSIALFTCVSEGTLAWISGDQGQEGRVSHNIQPNGMIWLDTTLTIMTALIEKYKASMVTSQGMKSSQSTPHIDCTCCRATIEGIAITLPIVSTARD